MDMFLRNARLSYVVYDPTAFDWKRKACDCRAIFVLSGNGKVFLEGKIYPLKENTICYYPAGAEYAFTFSRQENSCFISYNFDFDRKNAHFKSCRKTVNSEEFNPEEAFFSQNDCEQEVFKSPFVIENVDRFRDLFIKVSEEFKNGAGNEPAAAALLQYTLLKMVETKDDDALVITLYEKAVEYINQNYSSIKDNREIAEALNYHEYYINRIFKLKTGKTLHKYIVDLRLEKAANLLADGLFSVGEVAKSVGFYNADHFSKRFYEKYGMSPSVYKKKKGTLQMI